MFALVLAAALARSQINAPTLRALPNVKKVQVIPSKDLTEHRLIHILDWHFVPKQLFALERGSDSYPQHLKDVELVQREQMGVLRTLLKKHGLRRVYVEGLTEKSMLLFDAKVLGLRQIRHRLARFPASAKPFEYLLELGSAGRLQAEGERLKVLPCEQESLLADAKPVKDGKIIYDRKKIEAREDAIVQALKGDRVAVLLCGGSHDFSDNLRRLVPSCEYVRVMTKEYSRLAGEE